MALRYWNIYFLADASGDKGIAAFNTEELSSGMYFYSLKAGDFKQDKKMVLMKS